MVTTANTVGGLLPLWPGGDPPYISKAVASLSGSVFVGVLTLSFAPAYYYLPFRVRSRQAAKPLAELLGSMTVLLPEAPPTILQSSPKLSSGCFSTTDDLAKSVLL